MTWPRGGDLGGSASWPVTLRGSRAQGQRERNPGNATGASSSTQGDRSPPPKPGGRGGPARPVCTARPDIRTALPSAQFGKEQAHVPGRERWRRGCVQGHSVSTSDRPRSMCWLYSSLTRENKTVLTATTLLRFSHLKTGSKGKILLRGLSGYPGRVPGTAGPGWAGRRQLRFTSRAVGVTHEGKCSVVLVKAPFKSAGARRGAERGGPRFVECSLQERAPGCHKHTSQGGITAPLYR